MAVRRVEEVVLQVVLLSLVPCRVMGVAAERPWCAFRGVGNKNSRRK